jgi:hypothetical protein
MLPARPFVWEIRAVSVAGDIVQIAANFKRNRRDTVSFPAVMRGNGGE